MKIIFNDRKTSVDLEGTFIQLTPAEFFILKFLYELGDVARKNELADASEVSIHSNSVDVHVTHLRQKIGGHLIKTYRGRGYELVK